MSMDERGTWQDYHTFLWTFSRVVHSENIKFVAAMAVDWPYSTRDASERAIF